MNLIRKLNHYFIHDEDETAHISDYLWFYSALGFSLTFLVVFTIKLITF